MIDLKGKRLLVLGGKPIGTRELVERAKSLGVYTIVTDYLPKEQSPAKFIADEAWKISTADVETLAERAAGAHIDGVLTGVHEFNIKKMMALCEKLGLPCYCNEEQWDRLENKANFKNLCRENGIPVTKEYRVETENQLDDCSTIEFPVITKPVDGSGSRGFSICESADELRAAYRKAAQFSESGHVLVERYMDYRNSVIINYSVVNGHVYYSGMSDKHSRKVSETGGPIMAVQYYPSLDEDTYLEELDAKARNMLSSLGFQTGVVWIEAFNDHGRFTFNEMGLRFGGSLTYLPVEYFYGFSQLDLLLEYALTGKFEGSFPLERKKLVHKTYCTFPVHVRSGVIAGVEGLEELMGRDELVKLVLVHDVGDRIEDWGSAQQVFAYIHFAVDSRRQADVFARWIMEHLHVYDEEGNQLLFNLHIDD